MSRPCPRLWELDAARHGALSSADVHSHERHRATCGECRTRFEDDERLVRLGRGMVPQVDALRSRRVRMQVLRAAVQEAATRPLARWLVPALVPLALVVAITPWMARHAVSVEAPPALAPSPSATTPASAFAAQVEPSPGAAWSRERALGTERVALQDGELRLTVRHQQASERFLVLVPDGEIEVRGTRFEVTVREGRTAEVRVAEGVVALRIHGAPERVLGAGDAWAPEERSRATVPTPPAAPSASAPVVEVKPPAESRAPRGAEAAEADYARAMQLYDAHRYVEAASAFRAFVAAHPRAPEAEDAEFLEASSLAFSGRHEAAAVRAERFLAGHPRSFHARHAALLVGRAARDRGDCEKARSVLAPWSSPAGADVVTALGACAR